MSKILLLLAAVAALAIAASAAPDFNDLDTSDLDASAVDDSDLDDIDADDLLEDSVETVWNGPRGGVHGDRGSQTFGDESEMKPVRGKNVKKKNGDDGSSDAPVCPLNQFIGNNNQCTPCSDQEVVPYGEYEYMGRESCFSCPFNIDNEKICVTDTQLRVREGTQDGENQFSRKDRVFEGFVSRWDSASTTKDQAKGDKQCSGKFCQKNLQEFVQMSGCATGLTCCLPGYYGASSSRCTLCPGFQHSSPFAAPNKRCECPNSASTSCFACTNKCRPYDSASRMCLPHKCPSGKTCKTVDDTAKCV